MSELDVFCGWINSLYWHRDVHIILSKLNQLHIITHNPSSPSTQNQNAWHILQTSRNITAWLSVTNGIFLSFKEEKGLVRIIIVI